MSDGTDELARMLDVLDGAGLLTDEAVRRSKLAAMSEAEAMALGTKLLAAGDQLIAAREEFFVPSLRHVRSNATPILGQMTGGGNPSMGDLARALDVRPSRVSSWERLQERMPAALARKAAELLGSSVDALKAEPPPFKPGPVPWPVLQSSTPPAGWPREIATPTGPAWIGPPPSGNCDGLGKPHRWVSSHSVHGWACVSCATLRPVDPPAPPRPMTAMGCIHGPECMMPGCPGDGS